MATYKQTFTGDKSQLEQAYKDLAKEVVRLEQQTQKLATSNTQLAEKVRIANRQTIDGQREANDALGQGIQQVSLMAAQYLGFTSILQGVNQELEKMHELQDAAANTQVKVADSQAAIIRNMTALSREDRKRFLGEVAAVAGETQFQDLGQLNLAASEGLSAGGTRESVIDAVRQAARISRDSPQDLDLIVGAAVDLAKATGDTDARKNLGFLLAAGAESRVAGTRATAVNIPPAVISAVNTVNDDAKEASIDAAALFASLGSAAGDVRGESTRTAVQSFAVQAREFFTEGRKVTIPGRGTIQVKPPDDPGTLRGRIAALQADEKLRKQFLASASFERQFQVPVEQLLTEGGLTAEAFAKARDNIRFDAAPFEEVAKDLEALTPELAIAFGRRAAESNIQRTELDRPEEGRAAEARKILRDALWRTARYGEGFPGTRGMAGEAAIWSMDVNDMLGTDPADSALAMLRERQEMIRLRNRSLVTNTPGWFSQPVPIEQLSERERRDFDFLGQQIEALQQLTERQTRAIEEMNNRDSQRQPSPAPAAQIEAGRHRER